MVRSLAYRTFQLRFLALGAGVVRSPAQVQLLLKERHDAGLLELEARTRGRGERPWQRPGGAACANGAVDMEHGLEIENVGRRGPLPTAVTWWGPKN